MNKRDLIKLLTIAAVLVLIVLILLWRVLPVFRRVLGSLGVAMSESGSAMMRLGTALGWIIMILVALAVLAAVTAVILLRTKHREKVLNLVYHLIPSAVCPADHDIIFLLIFMERHQGSHNSQFVQGHRSCLKEC